MTTRSQAPIVRMILALIRNQPARYGFGVVLWITIWMMPIVIGLIVAAFFDQLTGEGGRGLGTALIIAYEDLYGHAVDVKDIVLVCGPARGIFHPGKNHPVSSLPGKLHPVYDEIVVLA